MRCMQCGGPATVTVVKLRTGGSDAVSRTTWCELDAPDSWTIVAPRVREASRRWMDAFLAGRVSTRPFGY